MIPHAQVTRSTDVKIAIDDKFLREQAEEAMRIYTAIEGFETVGRSQGARDLEMLIALVNHNWQARAAARHLKLTSSTSPIHYMKKWARAGIDVSNPRVRTLLSIACLLMGQIEDRPVE